MLTRSVCMRDHSHVVMRTEVVPDQGSEEWGSSGVIGQWQTDLQHSSLFHFEVTLCRGHQGHFHYTTQCVFWWVRGHHKGNGTNTRMGEAEVSELSRACCGVKDDCVRACKLPLIDLLVVEGGYDCPRVILWETTKVKTVTDATMVHQQQTNIPVVSNAHTHTRTRTHTRTHTHSCAYMHLCALDVCDVLVGERKSQAAKKRD